MVDAYLVGFIEKATLKIMSVGIFGEPSPTCDLSRYTPVALLQTADHLYGRQRILQVLRNNREYYAWIKPAVTDKDILNALEGK